jgi:hypothetical protein
MILHSHSFIEPYIIYSVLLLQCCILMVLYCAHNTAFRITRPALVFWSSGPGLVLVS